MLRLPGIEDRHKEAAAEVVAQPTVVVVENCRTEHLGRTFPTVRQFYFSSNFKFVSTVIKTLQFSPANQREIEELEVTYGRDKGR